MGTGSLSLVDYRRRVAQLYADVRATAAADSWEAAHAVWRAGRDELFATHPDSPLHADDPRRRTGLPVAPYDPGLRWVVPLEAAADGAGGAGPELRVTTGTDGEVAFARLGRVRTPLGPLDVWWLTGYGGGLWIPVRDATSGAGAAGDQLGSYGGGRYLLDTVKGADLGGGQLHTAAGVRDALVIDLNFLYNPSCAYDPAWACPLAPLGNRLEVPVRAGELDLAH